nr:hypothetical protein [Tanacetum cinerariifolium]
MEYLVKINKKARILELKQRHLKITILTSNTPYKEDTAYLCLHFTKDHEGNKINTTYPEKTNTPYSSYGNNIFVYTSLRAFNSSYLCLKKKYRLSLKNDMSPRDKMDNPNIAMEEYIRLEEEKARRHVSSVNNNEIDFRIPFDESDDED